jgi:hypothetical protein
VRALALTPAVLVSTATAAAVADPPNTWQDNPSVSAVHTVLVFVGIPLALFLLITLLTYLPSMRHRDHSQGEAWRGEPEWFGGPRAGLEGLDKSEQPRAVEGGTESARGGSSGRW